MLISLVVVIAVLVIVCWIISILPTPPGGFPLKTVLYVLAGLVAVVYLLRIAGLA
jgi:hypothetical protein